MNVSLILTLIGDDRPGLVEQLAELVSAHEGNWLKSSMAHLAGKFAGILEIAIPEAQVLPLKAALGQLAALRVTVEESSAVPAAAGRRMTLALVGQDRIGIVREVSQILARHAVNVESLNTWSASAPMSAETLFHADAELLAAPDLDPRTLKADLERIADDLMVDLALNVVSGA